MENNSKFTAEDVIRLIYNLDTREALRRFQPKHAIVAVNIEGEIVGIERFKEHPNWTEQDAVFAKYKGCAMFFADPEIYSSVEEIEKKIESCVETLKNREINKKHRGKGLVGDTYFAGRRPQEGEED